MKRRQTDSTDARIARLMPINKLNVAVSIDLDLRELAAWAPSTRRAFMIGLGEVMAAVRGQSQLSIVGTRRKSDA